MEAILKYYVITYQRQIDPNALMAKTGRHRPITVPIGLGLSRYLVQTVA